MQPISLITKSYQGTAEIFLGAEPCFALLVDIAGFGSKASADCFDAEGKNFVPSPVFMALSFTENGANARES